MKKQLITMGAVGLAMAGMNSGACADEVQAHPAATPNAVQTEAKTPQQQADSAREELERAGDEQAAARQNVAERQEEVQRKQDEYNQTVSGQEQAQKNADAKFQDLNEARKKTPTGQDRSSLRPKGSWNRRKSSRRRRRKLRMQPEMTSMTSGRKSTLPQKTSTVPGTSMTTETRRRRKGNLKTPEPSWTAERTTSAGASRTLSRIMLHRRRWSRSSGNW